MAASATLARLRRPRPRRAASAASACAAARPPPPPAPPPPPTPAFDWESLVGVKLFSGIAGIALVFAAVFFLQVLGRARLAAAAGPRGHRHRRRARAAGRLRAEGGAPLSGHRECARRRGDRDPLLDLLRRARALGPDSRAPSPSCSSAVVTALAVAALHPARVALHRRPRPARRLRDAGAALDRTRTSRFRSSRT